MKKEIDNKGKKWKNFINKNQITLEKVKISRKNKEIHLRVLSDGLEKSIINKNINETFDFFEYINIEYNNGEHNDNAINSSFSSKEEVVKILKEYIKELSNDVFFSGIKIENSRMIFPLVNKLTDEKKLEYDIKINNVLIQNGYSFEIIWQDPIDQDTFDIDKQEKIAGMVKNINENRSEFNCEKSNESNIILGKEITGTPVKISSLIEIEDTCKVIISGKVISKDVRKLNNGKNLIAIMLTDDTFSLTAKAFFEKNNIDENIKVGSKYLFEGKYGFDNFDNEKNLMIYNINATMENKNEQNSCEKKRVELHLHTQYSTVDAVGKVKDIVSKVKSCGHDALGISDHGNLQSFPEMMKHTNNFGIKPLYGVEGYLVDDQVSIVNGEQESKFDDTFIFFDLETTGLSPLYDEIIEIAAVKIEHCQIIDVYSTLVKPHKEIPHKITEITNITNEMVDGYGKNISTALNEFIDFVEGNPLVAHNAEFDMSFLYRSLNEQNINTEFTYIDTLKLSRVLLPQLKSYKLKRLCNYFKITLDNHHRAESDATASANLFIELINIMKRKGIKSLSQINRELDKEILIKKNELYHIIIYARNQQGLKDLYKLVSQSHLEYFYKKPRIPKSIIKEFRNDLIIGTACERGELFQAIFSGKSEKQLKEIVCFYDYLEVQPLGNNQFMIDNDIINDKKDLIEVNNKIIELGEKYNKLVVATGDVHFVNKNDSYYREILMHGQGYKDASKQAPLYYRTTEEMLDEFYYLTTEKAIEIVCTNTCKIADMIEEVQPLPTGTFPPIIDGSDDEITTMVYDNAYKLYGKELPAIVQNRIDKELNSIIKYGYSVLYLIAHKLVAKSLNDDYLVGSRGSVGSSFVATLCNITEVNPLPPHYRCEKCFHSEFFTNNETGTGPDLPEKICPKCGEALIKDGFDIPFETFLGFKGDKEPDIDLNFSGEYQPVAHQYTEEFFGAGKVFRAGTISTIADKTAYGFVKNYLDETNKPYNKAEIERLVKGCTGIKKTTGQHPGGLMVVPHDKDIYDFCPIQRPADDTESSTITTHFDYHAISGKLLKLDILGHDDPTMLKMLYDLTGVNPIEIPLDDKQTKSLFLSNESLNLKGDIGTTLGTYGIPEFGTKFVMEMLIATKPNEFADLVRISGLSHGTDVWLNNANDYIKNGKATIKEVIATRDDIMVYLMHKGLDASDAFSIMEKVRKGKGLSDEHEEKMIQNNVPKWYIESCKKIKYMFPKAHAVAYVIMAFRVAYYKVHYPLAYYAAYFTIRASEFDANLVIQGPKKIKEYIENIQLLGKNATAKDKSMVTVLEIALEMLYRDYEFSKVDLYKSHYSDFLIENGKLLLPLNSLEGVGESAAIKIYEEAKKNTFLSVEDMQKRTKASKTVTEVMKQHGCFASIPQSNQLSFF